MYESTTAASPYPCPVRATTISPDPTHLRIARWLAAGLGSGWLPRAPGTWGSLAALPPGWWLWQTSGLVPLLTATALVTLIGCAVCAMLLPGMKAKDPGWIVIDEWAGLWLTMALLAPVLAPSWAHAIGAFVAFRLFDILKPWPIRRLEHLGPPWWNIMADDLAAALPAALSVILIAGFLPSPA